MTDQIFITCPRTAQTVRTGYRANRGATIAGLKHVTLLHCPACGQDHVWSGEMGFWDNEPRNLSLWDEIRHIWGGKQPLQ